MYEERHKSMSTPAFLEKLYEILEDPTAEPFIAWQPDGKSFLIKKVNELSEFVLPRWFKHNNLQSFIRQLNMYSFTKTRHDSNYREFRQPLFQRGRRDLLPLIKRKAQAIIKGGGGPISDPPSQSPATTISTSSNSSISSISTSSTQSTGLDPPSLFSLSHSSGRGNGNGASGVNGYSIGASSSGNGNGNGSSGKNSSADAILHLDSLHSSSSSSSMASFSGMLGLYSAAQVVGGHEEPETQSADMGGSMSSGIDGTESPRPFPSVQQSSK